MLHAILLLHLTVTPQEAHHAEEFVHASMRDFDLFEYDQALHEAVEAYRLDPLPQILFNIGQCHRALGHWDKAAQFFERFLRKVPDAPNRQLVEKLLAEVQQRLQAGQPATSPAVPTPQAVVVVSSQPAPVAPMAAGTGEAAPPSAVSPVAADQASPPRSSAPWWLVGTGAVVAAVGGGLTIYEVAAKVPQPTSSQAQTANTVGYMGQAAIGVGIAALVGGVVWVPLRPDAQPVVTP